MRIRLAFVAAATAVAVSTPASANWNVAKSRHFVIYSDQNPDRLREFATRLEKYDQSVRAVMHYDDPPLGDGNRLTVFVMPSTSSVQKLAGDKTGFLAGFYLPRASGSLAFVPRWLRNSGESDDMTEETVFFHEYAHHLMFADLEAVYPEWLVEGFAEFMETAQFDRDGSVLLGTAPAFRAWGLTRGQYIPLKDLLAGNYDASKMSPSEREASLYGLAWLLTHYLYMSGSRPGQFSHYMALLSSGTAPLAAAQQAFGDLDRLDHDVKAYKDQHNILAMKLQAQKAQAGPIEVQPLSEGAAAVILLRAQSKRGVDAKTAEPLAVQIRGVEARYPGDELVEATLAEAELDSGHAEAAAAAADRVLKANPRATKAMILKARAIEEQARKASGAQRSKLFEDARAMFSAANKLDTEDPEALFGYYRSYLSQGIRPPQDAIAAMHYASDLVPQDFGLRMNSAIAYLNEGKLDEAKSALAPVAYSPHAGEIGSLAKAMIAKISIGDAKAALLIPAQQQGSH
ncbi:MAG TPA: hypothetical protein VF776_04535 [Sphingomicrobium sp.]